jgi:adenosylcobinamide-GDP ribazoletransferase
MWGAACAAVGFLTLLPVPERQAAQGRDYATAVFPLVGAVLGGGAALLLALPLQPAVAATLTVAAMALLTGGLHWDAWADVLDAALAPVGADRARRIAILDDSRVGAHAAWGTAIVVLMQVLALASAPWWAVCWGAATGRWAMVISLRWSPPLRSGGVGARLRGEARPGAATLVLLLVGAVLVTSGEAPPGSIAATLLIAGGAGAALARALARRLGGLNGDGHGAVGLLVETGVWLAAAEIAAAGTTVALQ